jgi:phage protein D
MAEFAAFLAPRYLIKVEGTKLSEDVTRYITSVEFTEQENSASKIVLTVLNENFKFLDTKIFAEGNKIDLWMGYVSKPLEFMARGIIVKPNPNFPRSGIPTMTVIAHDLSRKLMRLREDDIGKVYKKKRDSEIASLLFKSIEATPNVKTTTGLKTRVRKRGVTPWQFLKNLAKINGYIISIKYDIKKRTNVGYFGPPLDENQPNKYNFIYGSGEQDSTLLDFRPDMSLASQETKLEMSYTDEKTRKTHKLVIDISNKKAEDTLFTASGAKKKLKKTIPNGPSITFGIFGQQMKTVVGRTFKSPTDAKRFAAAWFQSMQDEFVLGSGTILGVADIRRGHVHELNGLGNRLSGNWHFTSVSHSMQSGSIYEVRFTARKVVLDNVLGTPNGVTKIKNEETLS